MLWALSSNPTLSLDTPISLSANNFSTSTQLLFSLPSSSQLSISIALCAPPSSNPPRVFVSNSSNSQVIPGPNGGSDVFEVTLSGLGLGNLTLDVGDSTGLLAHSSSPHLSFPPPPPHQPTYPNYTLPPANTTLPSLPPPPESSSTPNFTLFLAPLDAGLPSLPQTACAVRTRVTGDPSAAQSAQVLAEQMWLRDELGWRREWLVGRLAALTNYSVYAIQDGTRLSGPIYFTTKSASFSCQLVHGLPYCPRTAYSVPLPEPPDSAPAYNASNLPNTLATPLLAYLSNFTASLLTTACGRDYYSPIQTCADCQDAYRRWLCTVSLPRCGEFPQDQQQQQHQQQQPLQPALSPQPPGTAPRNAALGNSTGYTAVLPCIETCYAADRACPIYLGFVCPKGETTAAQMGYGVGFIDSVDGHDSGGGVPGSPQDQWGNVYCNGN
ncbi:stretch-activated Ca2+-permeable channel component-domain-containing protein [Russula emetica]|nr:stretch-activated Ca2+-permeable channel component-domain-containing protein [Russula emetica]